MKYRKKPVVVEAFKYDGDFFVYTRGESYIPDWAIQAYKDRIIYHRQYSGELFINTLEGSHHVSVGDYVIRGVKGELYPCKPDIFERTYEEINSNDEI